MLNIRKIKEEDAKKLWIWANDKETRKNSLNSEEIPWDEHKNWLNNKLKDTVNNQFFMIESNDKAAAFVRFEKNINWVISIVVNPAFRGNKIGENALRLSIEKSSLKLVIAYIKKENIASQKIFERNGFMLNSIENNVMKYEWSRNEDR